MKRLLTGFIFLLAHTSVVLAGPGHDHGDTAQTVSSTAFVPKVTIESDLAELVAVVEGKRLRIYLDAWADNRPLDASLNLELNGIPVEAKRLELGLFEAPLGQFLEQKQLSLVATVTLKDEIDLLAGDLVLLSTQDAPHGLHLEDYLFSILIAFTLFVLAFVSIRVAQKRRSQGVPS
jgi:hypothetical protein